MRYEVGEIVKYEVLETETFIKWLTSLKDKITRVRIGKRIARIKYGNFGDTKVLDNGVSEIRLKFGAGYRVYYTQKEKVIIILLCGGDKSTQKQDIERAKQMAMEV